MFNEANHPLKEVSVQPDRAEPPTPETPTAPRSPNEVLAKQEALNQRVKRLKQWVIANTRPGNTQREALFHLERAQGLLMQSIIGELQ